MVSLTFDNGSQLLIDDSVCQRFEQIFLMSRAQVFERAYSSRYCAWSSFNVPATFLMGLIWALPPTRDTEMPMLIAGRKPWLNSQLYG